MGVSTDAYLYYGFDIHDAEEQEPYLPDAFFSKHQLDDDCDMTDILERLCDGEAIFYEYHCSGDFPIYFIFTQLYRVGRGYPETITEEMLKIEPAWEEQLKAFCEKNSIPFQKPSWRLASYWG